MRLFGGFGARVFAAYDEAWPLRRRARASACALYQLYPLLVHVNLFGGGLRRLGRIRAGAAGLTSIRGRSARRLMRHDSIAWTHGLEGLDGQLRRLGHRRDVGHGQDDESMAALHRALDRGRQLLRHRRRLRRRPQRAAARRGCAGSARSRSTSPPRRGGGCPSRRSRATPAKNLTAFVDRSLKNLATETIDLLQLHCPPTDAYYHPEVFEILDDLVKAGKIRFYGVSVERVEEALKAIDYPGVQSVQIIFNMFRQRPRGPVLRRGAPAQGRRSWRGCRCRPGCWPAR